MEANEKIGPYRLMEPIGAGGMGTVWRAWDERLKRPVALKQFHSDALDNPRLRERFRREAEAQARLNHPAIVRIYDLIEMDAGDWIVMELVEGQTLQGLLETGLCDVQQSIRLGREIAEGLAEAHRHGLIHRDLKAANVMVTPSGHAKILDFGIVKQIQAEPQDTTVSVLGLVVGTSYAMSPEQSMALPLDARSDLFSLGSLLYEMATGIAPFRADTAQATLARVCNFRQRPASTVRLGVPQEFSDLIDRLLEKDPVHRPQDAHEVAALLENLIMTRPFSPKVPSGDAFPRDAPPGAEPTGVEQNTRAERFRTFLPAWAQGSGAGPPAPQGLAAAPLAASRARSATLWRAALWGGLILLLAIAAGYVLLRKTAPFDSYVLYREGAEYLSRYDRKGNLDRAIESFQRVLAKDDHHAAAHASLAKAYWMKLQGESKDPIWLDRALPMARRAVELDDDLAMAWVSLGLIHYSQGDLDEAARNFDQALRLEPRNADAYYGLGRVDEAQKRIPEAEAAHRKAIEIRPDRMYWDELGSLYYRTGKTAEAIRAFEKSIALAPDSFYGYRNLGAALYSQGDLDQAAAQFQEALQIQPDSTLYGNLGNLYFAQGFYDKSVEAFEKALVMPGGANSYLQWGNLGDACRWTPDKKERAREAYLRAIQLLREELRSHPQDVTLRSRLALYRAKRGDRDAALAELAGLETAAGKDARARYRMLVAYEALGARDKALAALGQALRGGFPAEEIRKDPELLALRADPRYHQLIASLGAS